MSSVPDLLSTITFSMVRATLYRPRKGIGSSASPMSVEKLGWGVVCTTPSARTRLMKRRLSFGLTLVKGRYLAVIKEEVGVWVEQLPKEDRNLQQVFALTELLPRGLAFHHAGLLPGLKVLVETLFARGHLRAVFATDTLALGINMPARSVIVGSLSKFDGQEMRLLTPNEYRQLTGRAGRRGMDVRR